jgi:hypothetical protein
MGIPGTIGEMSARDVERVRAYHRKGHAGGLAGKAEIARVRAYLVRREPYEETRFGGRFGPGGVVHKPLTSSLLIERARDLVDSGEVAESVASVALFEELTDRGMFVPGSQTDLRRKHASRLLAMGTDDRGRPRRGGPFGIY